MPDLEDRASMLASRHENIATYLRCPSSLCGGNAERRLLLVSVPGWGSARLSINVALCKSCGNLYEDLPEPERSQSPGS